METESAVHALAALAQTSRLTIFRLLVQAGPEGLRAGTIAERLGLPAATLSFHLNQLHQAGLIHRERAGRTLTYRADYAAMGALMGFLSENCCGTGALDCLPTPRDKEHTDHS